MNNVLRQLVEHFCKMFKNDSFVSLPDIMEAVRCLGLIIFFHFLHFSASVQEVKSLLEKEFLHWLV